MHEGVWWKWSCEECDAIVTAEDVCNVSVVMCVV